MSSNLLAHPHPHRPRLRVVLPLLAVCAGVIFFSLRDRFEEQAAHSERANDVPVAGGKSSVTFPFRQIPQRRTSLSSPFYGNEPWPRASGVADESAPDSDEPEGDSAAPDGSTVIRRALLLGAVVGTGANAGVVTGHVLLSGTPPPEREIPVDPVCSRLHGGTMTTRFFVVDARGGLGDVVVNLAPIQNGPALGSGLPSETVLLDQIGCEFVPYVLGLQVGQRLLVRNSDPLLHNVHGDPAVPGNGGFNRAQPAGSPDLELEFDAPELFLRIKCDLHPWMFAYVSVFDHPYFAVTQPDGSFQIPVVPPGEYAVIATHRKLSRLSKPISVRTGETNTVDFVFDVAALPAP